MCESFELQTQETMQPAPLSMHQKEFDFAQTDPYRRYRDAVRDLYPDVFEDVEIYELPEEEEEDSFSLFGKQDKKEEPPILLPPPPPPAKPEKEEDPWKKYHVGPDTKGIGAGGRPQADIDNKNNAAADKRRRDKKRNLGR